MVSMDSTDPAGIGRMSNSRLNKKLPSTQSNLAIKLPLEYDGAASFGRWVLQQAEFLQQPFLTPRIAGAGISHRCTARKWIHPGLTQKGQAQQQKSDDQEALHGTSYRVFTSL